MGTIDYGINLGLAGDWVLQVKYTFFAGRPATRWDPEDAAEVSVDEIKMRPDAPAPKGEWQWTQVEGVLLDTLADTLSGSDAFLEKVGEQESERDRVAAEAYYDAIREDRLLYREVD